MSKQHTLKEVTDSIKLRSSDSQDFLRSIAYRRLVYRGFEKATYIEPSLSDINDELVVMYSECCGDWDEVYIDEIDGYFSI